MMQNLFADRSESLVEKLKRETRPIVVYGMGNGADKIFGLCERHGIVISDIYASDEFVRGHSFRGIRVKKYSEICGLYDDFVILLAFAVFRDDLMKRVDAMAHEHTLLVPDTPLFGEDIFDYDYFEAHLSEILRARELLADELSKSVFTDIINAKLTGDYFLLRRCETERSEVFENIIKLGSRERYVDLGAYDGDTITEFLAQTGGLYSRITAFEPDDRNRAKLEYKYSSLDGLKVYPYASWSENTTLHFSGNGGRMSCIDDSGRDVEARALDSVVMNATYIKMDVEGAERETLIGCRRIIAKGKPALAVSAYHRAGDIFELVLQIHDLCPEYRIYLRHHKYVPAWETNIYAAV